ncbi:hypothetical protein CFC21_054175 [Triticum aestivum]|uniref:TF-B3 domain-containing protein n=2 Tax=Triticum aestivum TaxID=4565 RepID=A0A9R1GCN4_WHEAT|nr:hypothetical protein CFC21_054175 [Triticum aestivum]
MTPKLEAIPMILDFTKYFLAVPTEFKVKTNTGCSWRVTIRLINGRVTLDQGWATFIVVHQIKIRYIVTFNLPTPNTFKVMSSMTTAAALTQDPRNRRLSRSPRPYPCLHAPARPATPRRHSHAALCTSMSHGRHPTAPLTPPPHTQPGPRDPLEPRRQTAPPSPTLPGLCPTTPFGGGEGREGEGGP